VAHGTREPARVRALELLAEAGAAAVHRHDVGLANRFLTALALPPSSSAIVSVAVGPAAAAALESAGVAASTRAGRLRLSFHLYTTADDADRAAEALRGHVLPA
jgi:selenocysteine lyase/cysteine desulfurase